MKFAFGLFLRIADQVVVFDVVVASTTTRREAISSFNLISQNGGAIENDEEE